MVEKSIFPKEMMSSSELSIEVVAARLTFFHEQLHLLHWQTQGYPEHVALGGLYEYVHSFKDDVIEKLMGYAGRRIKVFRIEQISETTSEAVVSSLIKFAHDLKVWAGNNAYDDVENLAQSLSGEAAKTRYLLTLS